MVRLRSDFKVAALFTLKYILTSPALLLYCSKHDEH